VSALNPLDDIAGDFIQAYDEVKPAIQLKKLKADLAALQTMAAYASDDESARIYARRIDDVAKKIVDLEQGR
jgi:hypothetical protein